MASNSPPEGYHTVTTYLLVSDAARLLDFARDGLGARELSRHVDDDGRVRHAEIQIGDTIVMLGQAEGEFPPMPSMLYHYVADADASYERALAAGATSVRPPADQHYGDRSGGVIDPVGNQWWFATPLAS